MATAFAMTPVGGGDGETGYHVLRQVPEGFPLGHRSRRHRHLLDMSPDPKSIVPEPGE